jgi:hypothetical protein
MHMLLIYAGGRQEEAILLAGSGDRMRVTMPGRADVVEFRLIDGEWMGESGAAVKIGAIAPRVENPGAWFEEPARPRFTLAV